MDYLRDSDSSIFSLGIGHAYSSYFFFICIFRIGHA